VLRRFKGRADRWRCLGVRVHLSRSRCRPLLDLLLFAEKIVDFGLQFSNPLLLPLCRCLPVLDKAVDQQILQFRDPRALLWGQKPSVLAHPSPPPEGYFVLSWATSARNHQFLFSPLFTIFFVLGVTAARPSRSKLSASCETALLAAGIGQLPATSRACSARSNHSNASSITEGIRSPHLERFFAASSVTN